MAEFTTIPIIQRLHELRFDVQDALLKVQQDKPIDMSGIDERVEELCETMLEQPPEIKDQAEPLMTEIISTLEQLAYALQDAIDADDGENDWDEVPANEGGDAPKGQG